MGVVQTGDTAVSRRAAPPGVTGTVDDVDAPHAGMARRAAVGRCTAAVLVREAHRAHPSIRIAIRGWRGALAVIRARDESVGRDVRGLVDGAAARVRRGTV